MNRSTYVLVTVILFSAPVSAAEISAACRAGIDEKVPGWQLSPPPPDLAAYAKEQKIETNVAYGDFDDDKVEDTAVLVSTSNVQGSKYLVVCLKRKKEPEIHVIKDPYCRDGIAVSQKGESFHNYDTGREEKYPTDGVSAYCFEKAGGTYLYKKGVFELVVDSD